jgi:hypothetical protein
MCVWPSNPSLDRLRDIFNNTAITHYKLSHHIRTALTSPGQGHSSKCVWIKLGFIWGSPHPVCFVNIHEQQIATRFLIRQDVTYPWMWLTVFASCPFWNHLDWYSVYAYVHTKYSTTMIATLLYLSHIWSLMIKYFVGEICKSPDNQYYCYIFVYTLTRETEVRRPSYLHPLFPRPLGNHSPSPSSLISVCS